jgi:uncharacterized protein YjbI with pentapeptide repeats
MPTETTTEVKNFKGQKFYDHDFSNQDLRKADMRRATFIDCNFDNADMTYADCEGSNFYRSSFKNTKLYYASFKNASLAEIKFYPQNAFGLTISLDCNSFDNVEISAHYLAAWMYDISTMKVPEEIRQDIYAICRKLIGAEKFERLAKLIEDRSI